MENISNKKLLLLLAIILILFIIINYFINQNRNSIINYKDVTSADQLTNNATEITERKMYYTLSSIITNYINSYNNAKDDSGNAIDLENESEYSYDEFYEALYDPYKNYLGKKKYLETANIFMNKFLVKSGNEDTEIHYFMDTNAIIKKIYEIEDDTYICKLYSSYNNKDAYIGIMLNSAQKQYSIFIIE